ncbi:MAG: M3 family metallopeptidase [Pseudomonadota bacterium]
MSATVNPLLDPAEFIDFAALRPEHVAPAIRQLIDENRALIEARLADTDAPCWENFVQSLTEGGERLNRAWGVVGHLHSVMDTPPWREAYNALLPEVAAFYAEQGQNLALYAKYKAIHDAPCFGSLDPVRQRIIEQSLRDFRLSGAELPEVDKPRFKAIQEELSALAAKFSENLLDATSAWTHTVHDEAGLSGLPEEAIRAAREAAERAGQDGWLFTLHMPSYLPVMQYADDRALRETLYRAHATRASEFGPAERDNGPVIGRILALRSEQARLLGYRHYAEVSLVPKMARSVDEVTTFLRELARRARPYAEKDLTELRAFAAAELGLAELMPWDIPYAAEKLRKVRYDFSENELRRYLPEPCVIAGLFGVIETLFGVSIVEDRAPVWHPDVRFYRVEREGSGIGHFYLDLYARTGKRGGAWMDSARSRARLSAGTQTPVAYLVCNFPGPVGTDPATFTHNDVLTLFHEFGHGLHHLLTEVDELAVSGIHGVEWDAVELPSQFMENFCWEWDVLHGMTAHVQTGEPLPRTLYDRLLAARNFHSGLQMLRQIEFALFDLLLHSEEPAATEPVSVEAVLALIETVRREVALIHPPAWHRFPHGFAHIFAGGYAAGYYSYKWAEVLSADAFAAFEEAGGSQGSLLDAATGGRFWREILAVGGSRPALDSFRAFRGRDPQIDALLRHSGMEA